MPTEPTLTAMPLPLAREWQAHAVRIKAALCARRLWDEVLTQSERQRLGGDLEALYRRHGTAGIWMKLRGVSLGRAVVEVACELGLATEQSCGRLLRALGELQDDPDAMLQRAITAGDLVLVERPRAAYWAGQRIALDWDNRSALWSFFWELCRSAKAGQPLDAADLGEEAPAQSVAKQKSRLLAHPAFPTPLGDLIRPAGRGTQKLDLPAERIHLLELLTRESLKEWTA